MPDFILRCHRVGAGFLAGPKIQYTKSENVSIAYQVLGSGPVDIVFAPGWLSNIELMWDHKPYADFLTGIARFSRLILFDKRGTGLSDRNIGLPTLEDRAEDIRAVMDAASSEKAVLFGVSEGGNMAAMFAASTPERTISLILFGCFAKRAWAEDHQIGETIEDFNSRLAEIDASWGEPVDLGSLAPSMVDNEEARLWMARFFRASASRTTAMEIAELNYHIDIRQVVTSISCPSLVLHRLDDKSVTIENGRDLARRIPGARLVELPGSDHLPFYGNWMPIVDQIEEFATGQQLERPSERVLLTVLFTDIVGSTVTAAKLGDEAWKQLLEQHDEIVCRAIEAFQGNVVKSTGDGILATFSGPTRAIQCAATCRVKLNELGISIRAGIHIGECERRGRDISGLAVHIAARIMDKAGDGTTVVSGTVKT